MTNAQHPISCKWPDLPSFEDYITGKRDFPQWPEPTQRVPQLAPTKEQDANPH